MDLYNIDDQKLNQFMIKKALKDAGLMGIIILTFILILGLATEMKVIFLLLQKGAPYILLILAVLFFFSMLSSGIPSSTRYALGENFFERFIMHDEVNAFTQHTLNRLERRNGQRQRDRIYFNETKSIKIAKDKIIIKGDHYNFMNGNGRIVIPCEVENYDELKTKIENICRSNRNIDRQFDYSI